MRARPNAHGNAGTWYSGTSSHPAISNYPKDQTPEPNSLAIWRLDTSTNSEDWDGHVAYVESVDGDSITISEFNWDHAEKYDTHVFSAEAMQHRGSYSLQGYVHVEPVDVINFFQKNANGIYDITCPVDNLVDAQFQLNNPVPKDAIALTEVAMALHRESDDSFVTDIATQSAVNIAAGGVYQFPRSFLTGTNQLLQPGIYRLVAKVNYGGIWIELNLHLPFRIMSRSDGCGLEISDSLVTALANSSQVVSWFYFDNASTGWYIVNSTGAVYFLVRGDAGVTGTILWRPLSNAPAFYNYYPAAGQTFTSVALSADGKTVTFGNATGVLSNDPLVSQIANTTQVVSWYYFDNAATGWYIANSAATVYYLVGGDTTVNGTILWKPINNAPAFYSYYPAAPQNFSSVSLAPDGGTVSFGSVN